MLSIESLQGALQKALAYSNARAASFSPTKDAGGDGEQDFLDGEGNLVDEMVAIDTIRALPEPDRATAIAEATARGSFKALQPFLTAESSGLALMDGCTVNASEEDWSVGRHGLGGVRPALSSCSYLQSFTCRASTMSIAHTASSRSCPHTACARSICFTRVWPVGGSTIATVRP